MAYRSLRRITGAALVSLAAASGVQSAPAIPPDFVVENAVPGATFDTPVAMAFLPDGRFLVAEKRGRVWVVSNGAKVTPPLWDRESEVLDFGDRGLLGLAVDPNFSTNRYVYFLYTVDPDTNGVDDNDDAFGRLTRYQVSLSNPNLVDPASRSVLFGRTWAEGPCIGSDSHTIGSLRFGIDGSLLVSIGDGAQYKGVDAGGHDDGMFGPGRTDPSEDIGSFRSQDLESLAGKILRLNPANGHGYPSNPYDDGDLRSVRSRIWAYGVRNPFRFNVRPGSGSTNPLVGDPGTLYVGDVGWETWEELDIVTQGGRNLGWPCYEGPGPNSAYQGASPSHHDCGTIGTPENPALATPPASTWHHTNPDLSDPEGFVGNAVVGGVFYNASLYPSTYRGAFFFGDYGADWIRVARVDGNDNLIELLPFVDTADGPVDFTVDPSSGDVFYVAIGANEVRRIRYTGSGPGNSPPVAVADASPDVGVTPLLVSFTGSGSADSDGDPLSFSWVFGDGSGSTVVDPQHTYVVAGTYDAVLTVSDGRGGIGRDTVTIVAAQSSGFPSTGVLDAFDRADGPIGGAWIDQVAGLNVEGNELIQTCCYGSAVWDGAIFGPDQEAYVTLDAVTEDAPEHDLMLKIQGPSSGDAHIEVRYDARFGRVGVGTLEPGAGWTAHGAPIPVTFLAGDQLGARSLSNGTVQVFKNGVLIGSISVSSWPHAAQGGRLGLTLDGALASRLDDFGGGNFAVSSNTPPTASILAPEDLGFYAAGQTVALSGNASDAQQTAASLSYEWRIHLRHNNHVHPSTYVTSGQNAQYLAENHDDGTGVWLEVELRVTDDGSLADTSRVSIYPEIDLMPSAVSTSPATPGTTAPADFRFRIHNGGRMPAPDSRWRLVADDDVLLAEGVARVPGSGDVEIVATVPPVLGAGTHPLRVVTDTLGAVYETNEGNNTRTRSLNVVEGPGNDDPQALGERLTLSRAFPNPTRGNADFAMELPRAARIEFSIHDIQGRETWSQPPQHLEAGLYTLKWPGTTESGDRVAPGLYLANVRVDGYSLVRRIALLP